MINNSNDIAIKMKLTLEEMYEGVLKKIKYKRNKPCSNCNESNDCPVCLGKGLAMSESIEEIKIPEGVGSGMTLQLKNKGHFYQEKKRLMDFFSINKSKPKTNYGSLIINVEEIKHDVFYREQADLIFPCRIKQSALKEGDQMIEFHHLNKELIKVQIPQNSSDGKILRIRGKGFKNIANNQFGSLLIKLTVINDGI